MDNKSLFKLSSGLFVISAKEGDKENGCIINTVLQATANVPRIIAIVNKDNYTNRMINKSGRFCVNVLDTSAIMELIAHFGFQSGKDCNKYDGKFPKKYDDFGVPYVDGYSCAVYSCKVQSVTDADTHEIFLATLDDGIVTSDTDPLTYDYYHKVLKGTAPKNASAYVPPTGKGFRCTICGHVENTDSIPADFICPICGRAATAFVPIAE